MNVNVEKSKIGQIVSKAETLHYHFKNLDPLLSSELEELVTMLRVEHKIHEKLTNVLYDIAHKL